jgi:glucans biosynthesis protein C
MSPVHTGGGGIRPVPGTRYPVPATIPALRYHELDAARAAAMILGVFFHGVISFMATPVGWAVQDRSTHMGADAFAWLVHAFRMPVFFMLSGFFSRMLVQKRGLDGFLKQRLLRLGLPFLIFWPLVCGALFFLWRWGRSLPGQPASEGTPLHVPTDRLVLAPAHFWFLYYLLMLALVAWAVGRFRAPAWMDRLRHLAPLALAAILLGMRPLDIETPLTFVPKPLILAFYGVYFFLGWLLHRQPERIAGYGKPLWPRVLAAVVLFAALVPLIDRLSKTGSLGELHALGALLLGFFSWVTVGLFIGLFVRFLSADRPWVAWLSDAAYWTYLVHLPVCVLLQVWLAPLAWPGPLKYALVSLGTLAACLGSYRLFVRQSWLGATLNGPRKSLTVAPSPGRI